MNTLNLTLTLKVSYQLNGENPEEMIRFLDGMVQSAIGNGLLTDDTAAEVESYEVVISDDAT
jgi:hypothetical protein